eukprot:scaffold305403_cov23-Tisochrysis_lutea.AAC.1
MLFTRLRDTPHRRDSALREEGGSFYFLRRRGTRPRRAEREGREQPRWTSERGQAPGRYITSSMLITLSPQGALGDQMDFWCSTAPPLPVFVSTAFSSLFRLCPPER